MWFHSISTILYKGGTKFASCFVCKQQGHLSKDCPENKHGIYPKVFHHKPSQFSWLMQDTEIRTHMHFVTRIYWKQCVVPGRKCFTVLYFYVLVRPF